MNEQTLCECGCGEVAPLAKKTDARKGHIKGQPVRFIAGHHGRMVMSGTGVTTYSVQYWTDASEVREADIELLRTWDDERAAEVYDARMRHIESQQRRTFVEVGMICQEMSDRQLWRKLVSPETGVPFHSFDAWMLSAAGVSRSSAYAAMKTLKELRGISVDDLREMPRCNAVTLASLSSSLHRDPKVIQAAKEKSEEEFIAVVQEEHPEQHVESRKGMVLKPTKTAKALIDECIRAVECIYNVQGREAALECLCAYFMDGICESEDYTEYTNRQAYELMTGERAA